MGGLGTLLGGLMGFGASAIPEVISLVRASYFHKFAMEAANAGHDDVLAQLTTQTQTLTTISSQLEAQAQSWMDFLSSSVRPILTYLFFGMFFFIKMTALYHVLHTDHVEILTALPFIWDSETSSLFAAIISFWFGSRALGATAGTATLPVTPSPSRVSGLVDGDSGK
jgi:tetrahydromethanopterin S-methyltransferase subunit E